MSVKKQIEEMEKKGLLKAGITTLRENFQRVADERRLPPTMRAAFQKRLDLLGQDWSERGNYFWMKRQIESRIGKSI